MFPGRRGKSLFTVNEQNAWTLIQDVVNKPDKTCLHRTESEKRVYKKKFATPVGVDGRSRAQCYCITVIYNIRDKNIVTAFPTM